MRELEILEAGRGKTADTNAHRNTTYFASHEKISSSMKTRQTDTIKVKVQVFYWSSTQRTLK